MITWKNEKREVAALVPADYNPRRITDAQRRNLTESLTQFGMVMPVVINSNDHLIGGHQRIEILADLGITEVNVSVPDRKLTDKEEIELNLRLNQNGGEFDPDKLKELNMDMLLEIGFGDEELSDLFDASETSEDEFDSKKAVAAAKKKTKVKAGQVYVLGDHRLMCGDSTDPAEVAALMGGGRADMVYCDPPYNIGLSYDKGVGMNAGKYQGKYNDSRKDADYSGFIEETLLNALANSNDDAHVFYWCDERYIWLIQTLFEKTGVENKRVCLWIKNKANPVPAIAFNKCYEPCVYGVRGRPLLNGNYRAFDEVLNKEIGGGNRKVEDIIDLLNIWIARLDAGQDYDHPTQKPVTLHEKPLKRCTAPGNIVLDLFGGSGSTLIAAEQLKRRAFLMEQEPVFCQVILNRWERLTGKKAKLLT